MNEHGICPGCGVKRFALDDQFWSRSSFRIKRALQSDRMLLRVIKAEWEALRSGDPSLASPPYPFPGPLLWLKRDWDEAIAPSHRPVESGHFYLLSCMVERLRDLGLSQAEILEMLNEADFHNNPLKISHRHYANLKPEDLRELSEVFRSSVGSPPDPAELWRITQWIQRRKASLLFRLSGQRIKDMKAPRGKKNRRLTRIRTRPTDLDQNRFKMVSVLVRQEGFTREDAVARVADSQGLGGTAEEILISLDRVWQYTSALAERFESRMPKPEDFWNSGCLRNHLTEGIKKR